MNSSANAPYLYLYIQTYCQEVQDHNSPPKMWHEHFYAANDEDARELAQFVLTMKNEQAVIPYVETGLAQSTHDVRDNYYILPARKERQPDGTYCAVFQTEQKSEEEN